MRGGYDGGVFAAGKNNGYVKATGRGKAGGCHPSEGSKRECRVIWNQQVYRTAGSGRYGETVDFFGRPGIIPGDVREYKNGAYGRGDCIGGDTQCLFS